MQFEDFLITENKKEEQFFSKYSDITKEIAGKRLGIDKLESGNEYIFYKAEKHYDVVTKGVFKGFKVIDGPSQSTSIDVGDFKDTVFKDWKEVQSYFGSKDKNEILANIKSTTNNGKAALGAVIEKVETYSQGDWGRAGDQSIIAFIGYPKASWRPTGILAYKTK